MTNLAYCLLDYEAGNVCAKRPVLRQGCFRPPELIKCNPDGHQTDPIAVQYSSSLFDQRLLAMADYDGYISMVNTSELLPDCINVIDEPDQNVKAQWVAHHNAINDLRFIKGDRQLLTAATDFNVRQWDTMTAVCVATMAGHSASVKCLSVHPVCSDVVASGGKDGSIMLWDLRVPSRATESFPVRGAQVHVEVAHRPRSPGSGIFSQGGTDVSITSLQFLKHSGLLASASDTSSTVKLWDVRMMEDPVAFLPAELPAETTLPPHLNMVPLSNHLEFKPSLSGLCHLSTDSDGLWLSVMRRDGRIHMYDALRADCSIQPSREFSVDEPLTLRSTTAISPDGLWLAATSAYGSTFVFNVHDVGAPPVKLHAGQASQWHRRNYDADGNSGYISTAARKDAEVTGVCWGKLGTGELAICRTAQQLQIWRSDYINHDLGMKPTAVADRARWPVLFDIAPETSACDARILVLSDSDELVVPIVQPEAALPCLRGTASFRLSGQASASVQRTPGRASAFITPASTVTGQPNRSPLPVDSNAAQHAPAAPSEAGPSLTEGTPAATAAPARVAASSSAAVHATPASGGNTPPVRHNSSSRAPGAALSAALLQPLPSTGTTQCSAGQRLAARHSIGAGSGNRAQTRTTHTARMHTDTIAGSTPASAATTSSLHGRTDAEAPDHTDRPSSDPEACDGADTDTGSAPPSRQSSVEPQQPISNSGRPSEHGLNNTFVEIAQSPQRLSRPARSLGQGLSPNVRASPSVQPRQSPAAQRDDDALLHARVSGSPSRMQPPLRAPLAVLSSSDLIRSPSALIRGGPGASLSQRATGALSPINELAGAAADGQEMVPDTQSIDGSPLCPTVAPVATQCSQVRQRLASQALTQMESAAPHLQPASGAASPQQPVPLRTCRGASNGTDCNQQAAANSSQCLHPAEKTAPAAFQQPWVAGPSASVINPVPQTERSRSRSRSRSAASQEHVASQARHARKRASCDMTADTPVHPAGEHGESVGRQHSRRSKHRRRDSCLLTPDAENVASHPKFQPPICDSQPKEVLAIVSSKRRKVTATSVQSNSRSQDVFKMAELCAPIRMEKNKSMAGGSPGCSRENIPTESDAQMLNIAAQQDGCSQDSHSVVPSQSRKMAVSDGLKALGKRSQGKAGAKPPAKSPNAPGSQPGIMQFFRRD